MRHADLEKASDQFREESILYSEANVMICFMLLVSESLMYLIVDTSV